jgi:hypothetical protein
MIGENTTKSQEIEKKSENDKDNTENIEETTWPNSLNSNNSIQEKIENYIKIDTKNQFSLYIESDCQKKLKETIDFVGEISSDIPMNKGLSEEFIEKLFPKCNKEAFRINRFISDKFMKAKKIDKKLVDKRISFFYQKKSEFGCYKKFTLDKITSSILGYILCYSYSKLDKFEIFEKEYFISKVNVYKKYSKDQKTIEKGYLQYCSEKIESPFDYDKLTYLEKKEKDYQFPGEFFFLMDCFQDITNLEIDMNMNFNDDEYDDNFYFFIIANLNIHYLIYNDQSFKINFNNQKLLSKIYDYYNEELISLSNKNKTYLKKNLSYSDNDLYYKTWDFSSDYSRKKVDYIAEIKPKEESYEINNEYMLKQKKDKTDLLLKRTESSKEKKDLMKEKYQYSSRKEFISRKTYFSNKKDEINKASNVVDMMGFTLYNKSMVRREIDLYDEDNQIMDEYNQIISSNKRIIELFFFSILGINRLKNMKNLSIIMPDSYYKEFIQVLGEYCISSKLSITNLHILNFIQQKLNNIKEFCIEFNSLDYLSFYKILSFIYNRDGLTELKLSFFPSLICYTPQFIYKLFEQNLEKEERGKKIKNYSSKNYISNELLINYIDNLEVLFQIMKKKIDKLEILCYFFDIPDLIFEYKPYIMALLKFILNILLYADSKSSKLKILTLIAPKISIDSFAFPEIDNILEDIDIYKENTQMNEFCLKLKLYNISNIKNIIGPKLLILKIGDMDLYTFNKLAIYLSSYNFFKISSLKSITIGLIKTIINFTKDVETILNVIYSIKIKTLKDINIYSNIFIKDKSEIYKIINRTWISSGEIILNKNSMDEWEKTKYKERIIYLVHQELEEELLIPNERKKREEKKFGKTDSEIEWYLRYILLVKFAKKNDYKIDLYKQNEIIFNILKYIYFTKTSKIEFKFG